MLGVPVLVSLVSSVEQQPHHGGVAQAVLQRRREQRVADHPEEAVHVGAVGKKQLHQVVPADGSGDVTTGGTRPLVVGGGTHLSARTATRTHRRGSSSVLAPAASSTSAQVMSPLETAKYKGVLRRSP